MENLPVQTSEISIRAGVIRGVLAGFNEDGDPMVDFPTNPAGKPIQALSTIVLRREFSGREAVLALEDGDVTRPILVGLIQPALRPNPQAEPAGQDSEGGAKGQKTVELDGERLLLSAEKEIVLRCGDASITLTRAGKVLIRGAYLLSRSAGANRIQGGSVQLN